MALGVLNINQKRRKLMTMIEHLDEARVDALLTLLKNRSEDLYVSEPDWSELERRQKEVEEGKVKDVNAREAGKRIQNALKKKRK
jgi:hypothetical protein